MDTIVSYNAKTCIQSTTKIQLRFVRATTSFGAHQMIVKNTGFEYQNQWTVLVVQLKMAEITTTKYN